MATVRAAAVRWAHGTVIALLVALAALIPHDTAAITATPLRHAVPSPHSGHPVPGTGYAAPMPRGSTPAHGTNGGTNAVAGVQHCTTGNVEMLKLPVPPQGPPPPTTDPYRAQPGPLPTGTVGRAPPDVSVLSQLRIWAAPTAPVCRLRRDPHAARPRGLTS